MAITLTAALEDRIVLKVKSGHYQSPADVIEASLDLLEAKEASISEAPGDQDRPIWEIISEIGARVPIEEWAKVPSDLSKNTDHYLYGAPKISE